MDKVTIFKPQVYKVISGQIIGGFTVIAPISNYYHSGNFFAKYYNLKKKKILKKHTHTHIYKEGNKQYSCNLIVLLLTKAKV